MPWHFLPLYFTGSTPEKLGISRKVLREPRREARANFDGFARGFRIVETSWVMATIPLAALRRHVVAWQGFAMRYRRATEDEVAECVRRLSCVQLDSIAAVERSHLLVLGARAGAVEPAAVSRLLASGRLFE
jgi:hypothetical protein